MNSSMQVFNSILQSLSILLPCHSVHSRCSVPLQRVETVLEQCLIDMVQQGGEPHSLALKRMSFFAASRTPSSPRDPIVPSPVRLGLGSPVFSLINRLPSGPSADPCGSLFGAFTGTMQLSVPRGRPLPACLKDSSLIAFSFRPTVSQAVGAARASRFPHKSFRACLGSLTSQGRAVSRYRQQHCCLPCCLTTSAP